MKRHFVSAALVAGLLAWTIPTAWAEMTIASDGRSDYSIVLPKDAPTSVKDAATELQRDIKLATGAELPIKADDGTDLEHYISLGSTSQAKAAGIGDAALGKGAYHVITKGNDLFIIGHDAPDGSLKPQTGTANGVYSFLEDELDVRWLMPGDIGRDVPPRKTFTLGDIDKTYTPPFTWRRVTHLWDFANPEQSRAIVRWTVHQRNVFNPTYDHDHNFWRAINGEKTFPGDMDEMVRTPAVQALYKEHPDWFAMNAQGKRPYPANHYAKLETTNPGLVKYFAELAIKTLKENPRKDYFSLSPSDGRGWSQSPQSKALYDPPHSAYTDAAMGANANPGMTSLVLKWYHDVATIVEKEYPQGKLAGYLYGDYVAPPTKYSAKLPDNFTPMICGVGTYGYGLYSPANREYYTKVMDFWGRTVGKTWYYYDLPNQLLRQMDSEIGAGAYYEGNFPGSTAIVSPAAPKILNFVFSTLVRNHIKGAYIYGVPAWSNAALANYLLAKMEWNPTLDAVKLQRQWLDRAYGPAAGAVMETFYNHLDQWMGDYCRSHAGNCEILTLDMLRTIYAAHYAEMEKLYLKAADQGMSGVQKQRLQLIGDNLIVLQSRLRNADMWPAGQASKLQRTDEQVAELLTKQSPAFPLYPGLIPEANYPYPKPPTWDVRLGGSSVAGSQPAVSGINDNMFLIYTPADTTVRITPTRVSRGAYFASYQVLDARDKTIAWGEMIKGTPIQFQAKANTPYYLYIPPRKPVDYDLEIQNAAIAGARLEGQTLTLTGPSAPIHVFNSPQEAPIGLFAKGDVVNIVKPYSGAAGLAHILRGGYYVDAKVAATMDSGWKFQPDPTDDLLAKGVTQMNFNDSSWATVSALDWWQMQGFKDYHGPAWYRIKFNLDQAPPPAPRRARLYFGGVDGNMVVYLNGKKVFEQHVGPAPQFKGWDTPSSYDVTYDLRKGENILAIKVTSKNDTTASGIFKGVSLITAIRTDKK